MKAFIPNVEISPNSVHSPLKLQIGTPYPILELWEGGAGVIRVGTNKVTLTAQEMGQGKVIEYDKPAEAAPIVTPESSIEGKLLELEVQIRELTAKREHLYSQWEAQARR